ncbi:MAG: hypothetical protein ACP5E4_04870, partial [Candidatus Aenigmatarchaeota archaeon]
MNVSCFLAKPSGRKGKGIALPVNSVIIIALAIFVLLMIAMFFGKSSEQLSTSELSSAFQQGCSVLSSGHNCNTDKVAEIQTSLIVGGEAKDLLYACRNYFNDPSMTAQQCK